MAASTKPARTVGDVQPHSGASMIVATSDVLAGEKQSLTLDLDPGDYTVVDFDEEQNVMTAGTTVGARTTGAREPSAKGTITLGPGMNIALPDGFDGTGVWKVVNKDPSLPHEAGVGLLEKGKNKADAVAWATDFDGPPPFETVGGFGAISPGHQGWVDLGPKRAASDYIVYCPLPGSDGVSHLAMGMATDFSVN